MPSPSNGTWRIPAVFFETLVLSPHVNAYQPFDHRFAYLFNS